MSASASPESLSSLNHLTHLSLINRLPINNSNLNLGNNGQNYTTLAPLKNIKEENDYANELGMGYFSSFGIC